jgi:hypothetical protein
MTWGHTNCRPEDPSSRKSAILPLVVLRWPAKLRNNGGQLPTPPHFNSTNSSFASLCDLRGFAVKLTDRPPLVGHQWTAQLRNMIGRSLNFFHFRGFQTSTTLHGPSCRLGFDGPYPSTRYTGLQKVPVRASGFVPTPREPIGP